MKYPLLPKTAKHLNYKRDGYRYLVDDDGVEWLVNNVGDKGRFIHLFQAGKDGSVEKYIWSHQFAKYRIVAESLSDEQEAAIIEALKT